MIDSGFKDSHNNYFHKVKFKCMYDIKLPKIIYNKKNNLTINGESINLYDLIKKSTVALQSGFVFIQINKLTIKFNSHLQYINKSSLSKI